MTMASRSLGLATMNIESMAKKQRLE